jgi:hypothetical protein
VDKAGLVIEDPDVDDLGVEDRLKPISHEVVHRLPFQPLGEAPLDVVDQRQLGSSLVRLAQQPFRLVEQAGVLERDAHAGRERAQQPHVCVVERARLQALDHDHAEDSVAGEDRNPKPRFRLQPELDRVGDFEVGGRVDLQRRSRPD